MEELKQVVKKQKANSGKAIIFSRVSSEHQDLVQQTEEVVNEAKKCGYENLIFIEQKESAIKLDEEERIGIQMLKDHVEGGDIECVFIYEISRLSRRPKMLYDIRDYLINHKVQLVCIKPYMRLLDDDGKLSQTASIMFSIFASLSESEMMLKKERMRRGANHAKQMGRHAGGYVMFGYTTDKEHHYLIDPVKGKLVKRIFEEYVYKNTSMRKLTRDLQEEGYFSNIKFLTAQQEVYDILHRDCYCGKRKGMPAIISEELYNLSVEKRKGNMLKVNHTDNMALLKGLLRDSNTGLLLSSNTAANMYYSKRMSGVAVGMHIIEPLIWERSVTLHKSLNTIGIKQLESKLQKRMGEIFMIRGSQVEKKNEIQAKIDKIEERLIMGKISETKAEELEKSLYDEIKLIDTRRTELNNEFDDINHRIMKIKETGDTQLDYENLNKEQMFEVVHEVIDKVMLKRLSRMVLEITIYNKVNENVETICINTMNKKILS